jgi:hypothetical protein
MYSQTRASSFWHNFRTGKQLNYTTKELQDSVNITEDDPIRKLAAGVAIKYSPVKERGKL